MMATTKKERKIDDLLVILTAMEKPSIAKVYAKLTPYLTQLIDDNQFELVFGLLSDKLGDSRFDLYLKLTPKFTQRQMSTEKRRQLINRMYQKIKDETRTALDIMDLDVIHVLDMIREENNKRNIKAWLLSGKEKDDFVIRAKFSYIYMALKLTKDAILEYEQILISAMEISQNISYGKKTGKLMPEILLSKNPYTQLEKLGYIHHKDAEAAGTYSARLNDLQNKYNSITEEISNLRTSVTSLKDAKANQEDTIKDRDNEIETLKKKLKATEDRLEYETHKFTEDSKAFKTVYAEKLLRRLGIEIEGMNITLSDVGEPEKSNLQRRISNIESVLSNEGVK